MHAEFDPPRLSRGSSRRRSQRVVLLIAAIIVLSLADLLVTLAHLTSTGMMEANPIAVYLIRATHSPWALVAYKGLTVTICAALLFRLRRHVEGEIAAWCAVLILVAMVFIWHRYSTRLDEVHNGRLVMSDCEDDHWLVLD